MGECGAFSIASRQRRASAGGRMRSILDRVAPATRLDRALDRGDPVQREWSVLGANQAVSDEEVMHDPTLQPATNPHHGNGAARAALSARWRVPRARLSRSTRTATWVGKDTTATARRNSRPTCTRTWRPGARRRADAHLTGTAGPTASTPNYAAPLNGRSSRTPWSCTTTQRTCAAPRRSHSTCSCRSGRAAACPFAGHAYQPSAGEAEGLADWASWMRKRYRLEDVPTAEPE